MGKQMKEQMKEGMIAIEKIREPNYRARQKFSAEELDELAESIRKNGLINAITVKPSRGGYEIVAGERRFLAHKKLKLKEIRATIVSGTLIEMELLKLDENIKRSDLTDIEEAYSYKQLRDKFKMSVKDIAKKASKSESYIIQKLKILTYQDCLLNAVVEGLITFSASRELARITDPIMLKEYVWYATRNGITPAVAKQWADDWEVENKKKPAEEKREQINKGVELPKFPCFCCKKDYEIEKTVMIRVCIECEKELQKAMSNEE